MARGDRPPGELTAPITSPTGTPAAPASPSLFVGTSGWQYRDWRGRVYPEGLPSARWLEWYADHFRTVELNNSFYRLPSRATFQAWAERTPDDFVVAVKASRFLTHIRRLRDPAEPVERFVEAATGLGRKLGPVLLQLPPTMRAEPERLDATLAIFPAGIRVSVEVRERSWFSEEVRAVLEAHGAAICLADRMSRPVGPLWRTADWSYLRLHEGRGRDRPGYGRAALRGWLERLRRGLGGGPAWVYFNNDPRGCAVRDAIRFAAAARRAGLVVSRTPTRVAPALSAATTGG